MAGPDGAPTGAAHIGGAAARLLSALTGVGVRRRGRALERFLNVWRLMLSVFIAAIVAGPGLATGRSQPHELFVLVLSVTFVVLAGAFHLFLLYGQWEERLAVWVASSDAIFVAGLLFGFVCLDRAIVASNSQLIYSAYYLVIALSAIRSDALVSRVVAVLVPLSYVFVIFLAVAWRQVQFALPDPVYGSFRWDVQIGRVAILAAVTWATHLEVAFGASYRAEAMRDPLTGAYNRRFLEEFLAREIPRARRRGTSLSVLVLDLDGFKAFNDSHGHLAGDRMLAEVAFCLAAALRESDVLARYGGDEFVVVLPGSPGETARRVARELMRAVPPGVRLSVGVGCLGEGVQTAERLLGVADQALLRAKQQGTGGAVSG